MKDRIIKKGLVLGVILLFVGASIVQGISINIHNRPDVNNTNTSANLEDSSFTLISTPVHKNLNTSNIREKKTISLSLLGFDLEANEVYLSSQPNDWDKEYVVTNPQAGDELYIHWVYTIWGSGTVDPFYWRIWLYVQGGGDVIDHECHVTEPELRQAGYIYKWCFEDPWIAPGGSYTLTLGVDSHDDISEDDEDNNIVSMDFTVTPTDQKFDMEANDVWLSSQPNDWEKEYEIDPDSLINPDTEIFFYFQWTILGNPETLVDPYYINITLDGPGGFEFEELIENPAYREAGYIITIYLHDEGSNGWFAVAGDYTLNCIVDSQDDVIEWNENNNERIVSFSVVPPFYFIHLTDTHVGTTGGKERFEEMVNYINDLDPSPAFVVISGDLVHWGGGAVGANHYQLFNSVISNLEVPYFTCPGNHDHFGTIGNYQNYINNNLYYVNFFNNVKLISMDAGSVEDYIEVIPIWTWPGGIQWKYVIDMIPEATGIENEQYTWLVNRLTEYPTFNQIVFMHNPVVCCYSEYNFDENCWNGCITKNRGNIMNRFRDPNNNGIFDDSVKLVLGGHVHTWFEYKVSQTNNPSPLSIPYGGYLSTNDLQYLPMYVIGSAAGEDMAYRNISVYGDEIRVYQTNYIESTVKYECDWIPWFKDFSRNDRNGDDIEPAGRLHIYDSYGNHVGINNTGDIDYEILGAYYAERFVYNQTGDYNWTTGETISVILSRSDYEYVFETIDVATLNVTAQYMLENGAWVRLSYLNITAYNNSVGKVFINNNRSNDFIIYWDDDGDGIVDRKIEPTTVITNPPEKPARPDGPTSGKPRIEYTYITSTTDLNGDQIYYLWDWGDGNTSSWLGPYSSGETVSEKHAWTKQGSYSIRVKAKDVYGAESDWSDPLPVSMPRIISFKSLFMKFLERFSQVLPILRYLLALQT